MEGACIYIDGSKQWNGREVEKSMMIVSYARFIQIYRRVVGQDYNSSSSSSSHHTVSYLERTAAVSSFLAVQSCRMYLDLSPLLPCMRVLLRMYFVNLF